MNARGQYGHHTIGGERSPKDFRLKDALPIALGTGLVILLFRKLDDAKADVEARRVPGGWALEPIRGKHRR